MILVLNAGSSSLKFALFDGVNLVTKGQVSGIGSAPKLEIGQQASVDLSAVDSPTAGLHAVLAALERGGHGLQDLSAIGHRLVHGGVRHVRPVRVDDHVQGELEELRALAPLHMPFGLGVLAEMRAIAPRAMNVACFDTAFHATQPELAKRLPLPRHYFDKGYLRYGFHGLSYEHIVAALPQQTGKPLPRRLLAAHLGAGASMCAILDGRSVATTMGYSTADGLVMGTRTGSIDPGVLIALMRDEALSVDGLEDLIYRRSGLLGLSGLSADMRVLLASDKTEAAEAVESYCYSAARHAASLVPALGGCDAMVFTGGVGENAPEIRRRILAYLSWLGLSESNVHVVRANEEFAIARQVMALMD